MSGLILKAVFLSDSASHSVILQQKDLNYSSIWIMNMNGFQITAVVKVK